MDEQLVRLKRIFPRGSHAIGLAPYEWLVMITVTFGDAKPCPITVRFNMFHEIERLRVNPPCCWNEKSYFMAPSKERSFISLDSVDDGGGCDL